jgi:multidrug efflux system membrane fusion protein
MPVEITTFGRVQAIASVALRSRIDGVIASVPVKEGQDVKEGDVLFTLDDRQARASLKQAEGALARDRAQLEKAKRDLARLTPLEAKSFVSKQQFDLAQSSLAALEGSVAADEAMAENARVQLSYTVMRAPISGRIGGVSSKTGNTVRVADTAPMLTINQLKPIYVSFSLPQASFPPLQEAMATGPVSVRVSMSGQADAANTGVITFVENAVDAMTNTVGVKATVANENLRLWPGQFVDVLITLSVEDKATVVPSEAVQMGPAGTFVFVVGADDKAQMRPVDVSRSLGAETVIAKGIAPGEKVVTLGQLALEPGVKVRAKTPDNKAAAAGDHP